MYVSIIGHALNATRLLATNASLTYDMRANPSITDKNGDSISSTNTIPSRAQAISSSSAGAITVSDVSATVTPNGSAVINIYTSVNTFAPNVIYAINFDELLYADAEIY
jgi:hypothetical protein